MKEKSPACSLTALDMIQHSWDCEYDLFSSRLLKGTLTHWIRNKKTLLMVEWGEWRHRSRAATVQTLPLHLYKVVQESGVFLCSGSKNDKQPWAESLPSSLMVWRLEIIDVNIRQLDTCHPSPAVLMETEPIFSSLRECCLSPDCLVKFRDVGSVLGLIPTVMIRPARASSDQSENTLHYRTMDLLSYTSVQSQQRN